MKPDKGRIRVISVVPGAARLEPLLSEFSKGGGGIITSFSERCLNSLTGLVEGDDVECIPFPEVVAKFLAMAGGDGLPIAAGLLSVEALADACMSLTPGSSLARSARFSGTHRALHRSLEEVHAAGISLSGLDANGALAGRLAELSTLDRATRLKLDELGRTTLSELVRQCVDCGGPAKFDRLMVIAGNEIGGRNLEWLQWAAECGTKVTLILERHATADRLFEPQRAAQAFLGVEAERRGDSNRLLDNLFALETTDAGVAPKVVKLVAPDKLAECEWIVRACLEERRAGVPTSAIAIVARNLDEYAPLLEAAARRFQLPLDIRRRVPLLSNGFAKLTVHTLNFCAGNDVRLLLPLVRSSYVRCKLEDQSTAGRALREAYGKRDGQWEALEIWLEEAGPEFQWIRPLVAWRREAAKERTSLLEWIGRLRQLMAAMPINPFDSAPTGARDSRAQTALQRPLYHLASVSGERFASLTLAAFVTLAQRTWEASDVSLPQTTGGVVAVDAADGLGKIEALFVMGMLEGSFPRRRSEDPVLPDVDRHALREASGNQWLRDSHEKAREERNEFYRVCAAAGRKLVLSYPETDDQRDNIPAFYLSEVERAMGGNVLQVRPLRNQLVPESPELEADLRLGRALAHESAVEPLENRLVTEAARKALQIAPEGALSPKDLSDVLECPFRFFARRRLHLKTRRPSSRWAALRRLPQRAGLHRQGGPMEAEAALLKALEAEIEFMLPDMASWEAAVLRAGGRRLIRDWVKREFAARKRWPKDEGSVRTAVDFEDEGFRAKVSSQLKLKGTVAAASQMGPYKVSHLFEGRTPDRDRDSRLGDPDFVYYGLHLLTQYVSGQGTALEVETMGPERNLYVLPRLAGSSYPGDAAAGLKVIDLSPRDDPRESLEEFFTELKVKANLAARMIRELETEARPGDACDWCELGELCRKSKNFSQEVSPEYED